MSTTTTPTDLPDLTEHAQPIACPFHEGRDLFDCIECEGGIQVLAEHAKATGIHHERLAYVEAQAWLSMGQPRMAQQVQHYADILTLQAAWMVREAIA